MPLKLVRNDITKIKCDAIVNAANSTLLGGGGVDGAIHRAAGKELLLECSKLGGCNVGQAKITKGYNLPCKYVIHTVGPEWEGGNAGERKLLKSCYLESLKLAAENNCETVAFPLISSGIFGYPKDKALRVAVDTITEFLAQHDMLVYIVVFDKTSFQISEKLFADISSFIDEKYVDTHFISERTRSKFLDDSILSAQDNTSSKFSGAGRTDLLDMACIPSMPKGISLEEVVNQIDESFSQMLLRKIDEKSLKDPDVYKKANIDRRLFSKIRSDVNYKPSKTTAIAFAIALELSLDETRDFLMKAGFALSHSNKFDVIIEYFINNGNYNIFEINEALFAFDQSLLGV